MSKNEVVDIDHGWKAMYRRVEELKRSKATVSVGVLASGKGALKHIPAPRNAKASADLTVEDIAVIHEYGTHTIPQRSFVRSTFDEKKPELIKLQEKGLRALVDGKQTIPQVLGKLGMWLSAQMKKKITSGTGVPPPLKQATIAAKGSSRPLVDTGQLVNSITWAVDDHGR